MLLRLVLIAGIGLVACGRKPDAGVKVDPALVTLAPPDTVFMAGARIEALLKTRVYQTYFAGRQLPQIEDFTRRTGLDARKDLWELLFVSNGSQGVLLGRGRFADETETKLEKEGGRRFVYKGLNLIGDERSAVMFISPSTAAVGEIDALHSLADERGKSNGAPAPLAALLKQIPAEAQMWAAFTGGRVNLPFEDKSNLANLNKLFASTERGTMYFDLRTGVSGVAEATCSSNESAQQVQGALNAFLGLARIAAPKDQPRLVQVYDRIRVTQEASRVKVTIDVPMELADTLLRAWMGGSAKGARPSPAQ
jgi:hypothetical protein